MESDDAAHEEFRRNAPTLDELLVELDAPVRAVQVVIDSYWDRLDAVSHQIAIEYACALIAHTRTPHEKVPERLKLAADAAQRLLRDYSHRETW